MGARKQELEVEEIISWPPRAPGEMTRGEETGGKGERMGEGKEEATLHFVFVYKITKAANAL